jgi:hypothetical protein
MCRKLDNMSATSATGATGGSRNLSTSLYNVAKQAAHPKFVWVFSANCNGIIIYNDPVDSWLQFYVNIKITIPKKNFFSFYRPPLSSSILSLLFHISFIHSISLQYFSLFFSLPLSHLAASIPHLLSSPRSTFRTFFPLLLPLFSLLVSTPESRHHFSLSCTLSPQKLWNFLYHKPLILPSFPSFFDSLPLFLLVRVFVPFI